MKFKINDRLWTIKEIEQSVFWEEDGDKYEKSKGEYMKLVLMKKIYKTIEKGSIEKMREDLWEHWGRIDDLFYLKIENQKIIVNKELIKTYVFPFNFNFDEIKELDFPERDSFNFDFSKKTIDENGDIVLYAIEDSGIVEKISEETKIDLKKEAKRMSKPYKKK